MEEIQVVKYNNLANANSRKSSPRSFPPPIPSLSTRKGASFRMTSHRNNGRLVLEAVSVSSSNNFHAERQDGRLVLTFAKDQNQEEEKPKIIEDGEQFEVEIEGNCSNDKIFENENGEEVEMEMEEEETEEERVGEGDGGYIEEEMSFVTEQGPKLPSGVISVHRLAVMMDEPLVLANSNSTTWSHNVKFVNEEEEEEEEEVVASTTAPVIQSLPTRLPVARMIPALSMAAAKRANGAVTSLSAYMYYWKPKSLTPSTTLDPITKNSSIPIMTSSSNNKKFILSENLMANEQQELMAMRGNRVDSLVPPVKGCREGKRSLRFWEPYCIATS